MNVGVSANVLSLCAGGGGLDIGLRLAIPGARTVCLVENEVTACGVLAARMEDKSLDAAPIWTDLLTFDGKPWRGVVDWVIGGYPCQPFSNAGKRLGAADPRHLWPHVARIVTDVAPRFCFFENVGAHLRLGGHEVIRELQGMGYRTAATLLTASEVGAPHGRERLFILAHCGCGRGRACAVHAGGGCGQEGADRFGQRGTDVADTERSSGSTEPWVEHQARSEVAVGAGAGCVAYAEGQLQREPHDEARAYARGNSRGNVGRDGGAVGDSHLPRLEGWQPIFSHGYELPAWPPGPEDADAWRRVLAIRPDLAPAVEPEVCNLASGMARGMDIARSDQLHILGNGVVPQQAAYALELLLTEVGMREEV